MPLLALVLLLLAGYGGPGAAGQRRKEVRLAQSPRTALEWVLAEQDEGRAGQGPAGWPGLSPGPRPEGNPQRGKVLVAKFFSSC